MLTARTVGLGSSLRLASRSLARNRVVGRRLVQTESLPPSANVQILNKQRLLRPSSPHFTIYQPQLTWYGSIINRATGGALSALLYGFSIAYLFAPGTFDTAHIVEFVSGMPDMVKYAGKTILAAPFAYHSLNGLRHLSWDAGKLLTVKGCYRSGYTVIAATVVSTIALVIR